MKRNVTNKTFRSGSLRQTGSAHTVLLQMAANQERAARIDALKAERPDLTWRKIANDIGVSERSAYNWKVTGGIDYENAKLLAKIFEVDVDYIWRGPSNGDRAPSPFDAQDSVVDELAAIRAEIQSLRRERSEEAAAVRELLEVQNQVLRDLTAAVEAEKAAKAESEAARRDLLAAVDVANRAFLAGAPRTEEAPGQRAT